METKDIFSALKGGLIVSCQSEGDDPFNSPEGVTLFAKAAVMGGAVGIRSRDIDKTEMIVKSVSVPVIGLTKSKFEDGYVRITGSFREFEEIMKTGIHMAAVDGTFRQREGLTGPEFIHELKKRYPLPVMADIATIEEGIACADAGADCISTTLSGYTPETSGKKLSGPDFDLLEELVRKVTIPVIAEGRINTPSDAGRMIALGAFAVVAGTAITRPRMVTSWYAESIKKEYDKRSS
ncbi:MAG: putative N-acetylmannosamine-6-phosphate 2-epimerase [Ignavibacteriaceae bacterium]|nr:putative N-acetylmannosamine-6-phosphate 2-epimerase [Ignavibacteriaceae bacterium]